MGKTIRNWFLIAIALSLSLQACSDAPTYAPVFDIANIEPIISKIANHISPTNTKVMTWHYPVTQNFPHKIVKVDKGVDFIGERGEPIFATSAGKVVYCGAGLRGYGNLIIIKHDNNFLSIYAHNAEVLVKQAQFVEVGQAIAKMGSSGTNQVKLHFEIRRLGKPINPLILVQAKPV